MKLIIVCAILGHILTGYTDCLMTFTPKGRFSFSVMSSEEQMAALFDGMPLRRLIASILCGVIGLTLCFFGYLKLALWMEPFSKPLSVLMLVSTAVFLLPGIAHHVICGTAEWLYVRLGRTESALQVVTEFFKKTSLTMYLCYIGLLLFSIALLIAVAAGWTALPRWACVFNPALLTLLAFACKIPAATNVGGALAFVGLLFLL